jgi:glutamate-1-semialdehyde 2,1-aminomutase
MASSHDLFAKAQQLIPGGVNSPVRACRSVGAEPLFIARAAGPRLTTVDGDELVDFVMSWGPALLGHAHPEVTEAACRAARDGASFGAPCPAEVEMAELVCAALPGVEMARMVSSGTEATMSALRLARGFTGRSKLLKFRGCYHGHADSFLVDAGSGLATQGVTRAVGVPDELIAHTLGAEYNDLAAAREIFARFGAELAAVIVEPVAGNMGLVPPAQGFLEGLRELCDEHGALLVFDEVITGFRVGFGGAQGRYGVRPDLTTLGKIIGGGFPVGAYGGRRAIMERIAPSGDVYQAGTLSGNPVAMAAGCATLRLLAAADYAGLEARTAALAAEVREILGRKGIPAWVNQVASMFTVFFCEGPVTDFPSAKEADSGMYARFYAHLRAAGVNLAPSGFETAFTSFAHGPEDFARFLDGVRGFAG